MLQASTCLLTFLVVAPACTSAPELPPAPDGVVQLSKRYDRLTANMDEVTARRIVDRRLPQYDVLETLVGLVFLRDVVSDATTSDTQSADLMIDVQGSLEVHAPCPGWDEEGARDERDTGFIELVIGVEASRVQRAFTGRATGCRFIAPRGSERRKLTASMTLEVDLGRDLALGESVPSLLVRVSDVSNDVADTVRELEIDDAGDDGLSMRVGADGVCETLIELETLGLGQRGTFLLELREDGRVGVRGRDSAWVCGSKRSDPCVRTD